MSDEVITAEAAEAVVSKYTVEDLQKQVKPLSKNGFVRFFQKIWRGWLGAWYGFADKHPKLSSLIYMAFFFIVFSEGVTILQFIIMTFLPYAFASMADISFLWPAVQIGDLTYTDASGATQELLYAIFNEPAKTLADGSIDVNAGLGNFIAYEIAVFLAQCINFPLQRNITYRSHGNPWWQAMWYFIGWVAVSIATNALWGIIVPFLRDLWAWPYAVWNLIKTVLTGGVSLVVFFFIFLVIFPDNNKMAKKSKRKYEKLVAKNAPIAKVVKAENKMKLWEDKATKSNSEKDYFKAKSQVSASVMKYNAIVKASQKPNLKEEQKAAYPAKIAKAFENAVTAIETRNEKQAAFEAAKAL